MDPGVLLWCPVPSCLRARMKAYERTESYSKFGDAHGPRMYLSGHPTSGPYIGGRPFGRAPDAILAGI